jgi:hypothetical protein
VTEQVVETKQVEPDFKSKQRRKWGVMHE